MSPVQPGENVAGGETPLTGVSGGVTGEVQNALTGVHGGISALPRSAASAVGVSDWSGTIRAAASAHAQGASRARGAAQALTHLLSSRANYPRI